MRRRTHAILTLIGVVTFAALSMAQMRIDGLGRGISTVGTLRFADGTLAAPSIAPTTATNTGFYFDGPGNIRVGASGIAVGRFSSAGLDFLSRVGLGDGTANNALVDGVSDGIVSIQDDDASPGVSFNVGGTPTLSSCGDGALATGSTNTSGRMTSTDATACTLTFSATFGGNSADCVIANLIANRGFVSAASATAFTVSSLTAGDDFMYWCVGR